jgi:hypothetical protein
MKWWSRKCQFEAGGTPAPPGLLLLCSPLQKQQLGRVDALLCADEPLVWRILIVETCHFVMRRAGKGDVIEVKNARERRLNRV